MKTDRLQIAAAAVSLAAGSARFAADAPAKEFRAGALWPDANGRLPVQRGIDPWSIALAD